MLLLCQLCQSHGGWIAIEAAKGESELVRRLLTSVAMQHAARLRLSLLVSLGLVPVACGGSTLRTGGDDDLLASGNGGGGTGSTAKAGSTAKTSPAVPVVTGGGSQGGSSTIGGSATAGVPTVGGAGGNVGCTSPKYDPDSGLVTCAEGYRHRPKPLECEVSFGGAAIQAAAGAGGSDNYDADPLPRATGSEMCHSSSDCRQFALGYCQFGQGGGYCRSGCRTDTDCGPDSVCRCSGPSVSGGICVHSSCAQDADCGAGSLCASFEQACGDGGFACQQPSDQCASSADCGIAGATCDWNTDTHSRECNTLICGRPFLVESEARVAPVVAVSAWNELSSASPRVDHLSREERALLAEHWTRLGQMEHASIAAFARFNLQLLALGAPPELVESCNAALADETAHARLCFQIASAYAGRGVGPGALDLSGRLLECSLVEIVELVLAEGCFGETGAALEALEAAEGASDPVIAAAYRRIAADEQRHAELAFQFVRWALDRDRDRQAVAACVRRAIDLPPSRDRGAVEVAVPCLSALLASGEPVSRPDTASEQPPRPADRRRRRLARRAC